MVSVRESVGVFHDETGLENAIDELLAAGFDRTDLSLLAGHKAVERQLGHRFERVTELEDDLHVPRQAYVDIDSRTEGRASVIGGLAYVGAIAATGLVVASGGTLALAVAAAALAGGGGGMIGALLARIIDKRRAEGLQHQLDEGGLLLWVKVGDETHERAAMEILKRHSADDVHVHDLPTIHPTLTGGMSRDLSFMQRLGL